MVFTTHADTVPPFFPPRREGSVLHARGASDDKGQVLFHALGTSRLIAGKWLVVEYRASTGFEVSTGAVVSWPNQVSATYRGWSAESPSAWRSRFMAAFNP